MFKTFKLSLIIVCFTFTIHDLSAAAKIYSVFSPDKQIALEIQVAEKITYKVSYNGQPIILPSPVSLTLVGGKVLGTNSKLEKNTLKTVNTIIKPVYGLNSNIKESYNEIRLDFKEQFSIEFRAYNDGAAYRFVTRLDGVVKIKDEQATFNFGGDHSVYHLPIDGFANAYEGNYSYLPISKLDQGKSVPVPVLVDIKNGPKVAIQESDLLDYPGLYLKPTANSGFKSVLPQYPTKTKVGGFGNFLLSVTERADYIAEIQGNRTLPWRVINIAKEDKDLLNTDLVYLLASESKIKDVSWIKPGASVWDWWNNNNLTGVDFKSGFNTKTYNYYIDFAAKHKIPYVIIDEGWSAELDLLNPNPGTTSLADIPYNLDLQEVMKHAKDKGIGIILWCRWHVLDRQLIEAMDLFEKWGVAGVKVDFVERDDQIVVKGCEKMAIEAAKRKILIDFHGTYKPAGFQRTYPNVINYEAVFGMEMSKFTDKITPEHDVTMPYIRMLSGPMDFTPGAMTNVNKADFKAVNNRPMSQGTRCHQLAMYVAYYGPLQMLADDPTNYLKEPEILEYLSKVPVSWDETKQLDGKIGDYILIARRKGDTWYIGGMTDWSPRNLKTKLDFLGSGNYKVEIFADGTNADRIGNDYKKSSKTVNKSDELDIEMASGGGWVAVISPK